MPARSITLVLVTGIATLKVPVVNSASSLQDTQLAEYYEPGFDLHFQYPIEWTVESNVNTDPDTYGGSIILRPPTGFEEGQGIEIGMQLTPLNPGQSIAGWLPSYLAKDGNATQEDVSLRQKRPVTVDAGRGGIQSLLIQGELRGDGFTRVLIPNGNAVYFVGTYTQTPSDTFFTVYDSLVFGNDTPTDPQQIWPNKVEAGSASPMQVDFSSWYAPTPYNWTFQAWCSSTHSDTFNQGAIDISRDLNNNTYSGQMSYNSMAGVVVGYENTVGNYYNHVIIDSGAYRSVYYHLSSVHSGISLSGWASTRQKVGIVGDHLHFGIISDSGVGQDIRTVYIFAQNDNYQLNQSDANCGRIHYP